MAIKDAFVNQLIIAMPSMVNTPFEKSVIFICEHQVEGTIGLIINRPMQYPLSMVFEQLHIESGLAENKMEPLLYGGPLQPERGFVVHRPPGKWRSSLLLLDDVTVTTSNDIIRAIANNQGPKNILVTLGYTGWGGNQLEKELKDNIWLVCPFKTELLYEVPYEKRWDYAAMTLGITMSQISPDAGHA
jgi:putative transcriptional regulator